MAEVVYMQRTKTRCVTLLGFAIRPRHMWHKWNQILQTLSEAWLKEHKKRL